MALNGYIKLHRKITEWGWYKEPNTARVFFHLLLTASFKPSEYKGYELQAGQVVVGRRALAKQLGLTEDKVRTALKHLQESQEITIKSTNKFSIVTIEKWALYQGDDVSNPQQKPQQIPNKSPHIKKVKNVKNNNAFKPEGMSAEEIAKIIPAQPPDYIREKFKLG